MSTNEKDGSIHLNALHGMIHEHHHPQQPDEPIRLPESFKAVNRATSIPLGLKIVPRQSDPAQHRVLLVTMYNKILIPLDGSKTAEKVLPYARYLAGKFKIPIELLAVIDIAGTATHMSEEKARLLGTLVEDSVRASEDDPGGVAVSFKGVAVTRTVEKGRADDAIVNKGERDENTLIAMATHGRSGLNRFMLGSVAEKVFRGAAILCFTSDKNLPRSSQEWK